MPRSLRNSSAADSLRLRTTGDPLTELWSGPSRRTSSMSSRWCRNCPNAAKAVASSSKTTRPFSRNARATGSWGIATTTGLRSRSANSAVSAAKRGKSYPFPETGIPTSAASTPGSAARTGNTFPKRLLSVSNAAVMSTGFVFVAKVGRISVRACEVSGVNCVNCKPLSAAASAPRTQIAPELLTMARRRPRGCQSLR